MKKYILVLTLLLSGSLGFSAENPQVKAILQEALKLYGDHQYVRALDLFKQVKAIDPTNATADEYIKTSQQRILEWELQGEGAGLKDSKEKTKSANWDTLLNPKQEESNATNAKDIIAARRSLVERMRNRSSNTDNIVQINAGKGGLEIVLFHDQLFLPGLQTLRDEALPVLANVAQQIRDGGDRDITIKCAAHNDSKDSYKVYPQFALPARDPSLPNATTDESALVAQNIEATRALILFTYLAQKGMTPTPLSVKK